MILTSILALTLSPAQTGECVPAPQPGHSGASIRRWYISSSVVTLGGKVYTKYGLPRVLHKDEVRLYQPYKGGFFYVEKSSTTYEVLYLLTQINGCEFQPYVVKD